MRCLACDEELTDREAVRRSSKTGEFIELCDRCYKEVEDSIPAVEESLKYWERKKK